MDYLEKGINESGDFIYEWVFLCFDDNLVSYWIAIFEIIWHPNCFLLIGEQSGFSVSLVFIGVQKEWGNDYSYINVGFSKGILTEM